MAIPTPEELHDAVEMLRAARRILICSHESPEADCLGSALALGFGLEQLGAQVAWFNPDPVPRGCRFLPGWERVSNRLPESPVDLVVVTDCGSIDRLAFAARQVLELAPIVNLDHHGDNTRFGKVNVVRADLSSAGELAYHVLKALSVRLEPAIVDCLYAAIMVDTGGFRYANTSADTLGVAKSLVERGASPQRTSEALYENSTLGRMKLLGRLLETLTLGSGGRWGLVWVTQATLAETGCTLGDTEEFVNYPRSIEGVDVAIFLKELPDGRFGVSLRAAGRVNVQSIARQVGGGGHPNAAGCRVSGPLAEARATMVALVEAALAQRDSLESGAESASVGSSAGGSAA